MYSTNSYGHIKPSQLVNIGYLIAGIVFFFLVFPPILFIIRWLEVYFWRYEFHERSLVERKGILDVTRNELLYSRIKSVRMEEPLLYRFFGLSNVYIESSDPYLPQLKLYAVSNGKELWDALRTENDNERTRTGARELDFFNLAE